VVGVKLVRREEGILELLEEEIPEGKVHGYLSIRDLGFFQDEAGAPSTLQAFQLTEYFGDAVDLAVHLNFKGPTPPFLS